MRNELLVLGAEPVHLRRYEFTWGKLIGLMGGKHLDIGGPNCFSQWMRSKQYDVTSTDGDLRYGLMHDDAAFDSVSCCEVLEHLKDQDADDVATFSFSGMHTLLAEIWRVLKPGGTLLLTTPNLCSLRSLNNMLQHRHPFMYEPHVRELSFNDVMEMLGMAGFVVDEAGTENVWGMGGLSDHDAQAILRNLHPHFRDNRGDMTYAKARKPH